MNGLGELFLVSLSAWQIVEIIHHGSIFEGPRARLEALADRGVFGCRFLDELVSCPFCLSVWAALVTVTLQATPLSFLNGIFAVSRLANVANDATRRFSRTPNRSAT